MFFWLNGIRRIYRDLEKKKVKEKKKEKEKDMEKEKESAWLCP
jgi:hypothetical protein